MCGEGCARVVYEFGSNFGPKDIPTGSTVLYCGEEQVVFENSEHLFIMGKTSSGDSRLVEKIIACVGDFDNKTGEFAYQDRYLAKIDDMVDGDTAMLREAGL